MPNGLWYARGPRGEVFQGKPASAFSKGDFVMFNSSSSLSGWERDSSASVVGIALADSNDSYNDEVPYLVPNDDTIFWSRLTAGSAITAGYEGDFTHDGNGRPVATNSANTVAWVVVERETDLPDQSIQSRIQLKLLPAFLER